MLIRHGAHVTIVLLGKYYILDMKILGVHNRGHLLWEHKENRASHQKNVSACHLRPVHRVKHIETSPNIVHSRILGAFFQGFTVF